MNKLIINKLPAITWSVFVLGLVVGATMLFSLPLAKVTQAGEKVSVAEAQARIERGDQLDSIPKSTWKQLLTPEQYHILWRKGTEQPFSGELLKDKGAGVYVTAGCRLPVFHSTQKFDSGTGWPSFWEMFNKDNIVLKKDWAWGMTRIEVLSKCGEHLGHVFDDGPGPTGLRYCINSTALAFIPDQQSPVPGKKSP